MWLPTIILWFLFPLVFKKYWKVLVMCALWALVFSVPWDIWAKRTRIWDWPAENVLGIYIQGLPLEEYFFIIFVTVLISTITLVFYQKSKKNNI